MYHFKYVTKQELAPFKNEIIDLIHLVQDDVREHLPRLSFLFGFGLRIGFCGLTH